MIYRQKSKAEQKLQHNIKGHYILCTLIGVVSAKQVRQHRWKSGIPMEGRNTEGFKRQDQYDSVKEPVDCKSIHDVAE